MMILRFCRVAACAMALTAALETVEAQAGVRGAAGGRRPAGQPPARAGRAVAPATPAAQRRLVQEAVARAVRNQLGLNTDQMERLRAIDTKYSAQRIDLDREETQLRNRLRRSMQEEKPDTAVLSQLLDQLTVGIPQRHLEIQRGEQRELAAFLDPLRRAKYVGIREQVRSRIEAQGMAPPAVPQRDSAGGRRGRGGQ